MKRNGFSLVVLLGLVGSGFAGSGVALAQEKQPVESLEQRIQRLVSQLGHDEYATREAAQKELEAIGRPALSALEAATRSEDLDVAIRAEEAIASIRKGPRERTRERDRPEDEARRPQVPQVPQPPDMDEILKDMERQLPPGFGKELFKNLKELFGQPGPGQDPNADEERTGNGRIRFRTWTWGNLPKRAQGTPGARLGLSLGRPSAALRAQLQLPRNEGLVINRLEPDGPAARAGLHLYDVLVAVDGRGLRSERDLETLIEKGGRLEYKRCAKLEVLQVAPLPAKPQPKPGETGEQAPQRPAQPDKQKERSF